MEGLEKALRELGRGNFVLLYDSEKREAETDMIILGEYVKPEDVARMRREAGGLICVAYGMDAAERTGLPFMADILAEAGGRYPILGKVRGEDIRYDRRSAFSLSVNHRRTFTGISDIDRALTISELGIFCRDISRMKDPQTVFGSRFRSPGHVNLLVSSGLDIRQGHTELACALAGMGGLTQCVVVCEMMDDATHRSLTLKDAKAYAKKNSLVLLEGKDIMEGYDRWRA